MYCLSIARFIAFLTFLIIYGQTYFSIPFVNIISKQDKNKTKNIKQQEQAIPEVVSSNRISWLNPAGPTTHKLSNKKKKKNLMRGGYILLLC